MNSSEPVGSVQAPWRFPVKSMRGEKLDAADLGEDGIVGDRAYAIRDKGTGKVASAKHPKLWPNLLGCRAAFVEPPRPGSELPPAQIELADGTSAMSDAPDVDAVLSRFFARDVELARAADNGRTIAIGDDVRLNVALPDPRCVMPSLAHEELPRDPRILKTLAQHNRIDVAGSLYPCAGVYAVAEVTGPIRKGDRISLV